MAHQRRSPARTLLLLAATLALVLALLPTTRARAQDPAPTASSPAADAAAGGLAGAQGASTDGLVEATARPVADVNVFTPGESETGLWIVQLTDDALATHAEGREEFRAAQGGQNRLDVDTAPAQAYRQQLEAAQDAVIADVEDILERSPAVPFRYTAALNGFTVEVSPEEARQISQLPGVASVQPDFLRQLTTDAGPEFIGALTYTGAPAVVTPTIETDTGTETLGEGIVAGILDSGISPANPSFAASVPIADGGDGYVHTWSQDYLGVCDPGNDGTDPMNQPDPFCNDKLVGAWNFIAGAEFGARDDDGHGSHTGSTTAGNQVLATIGSADSGTETEVTISGVAPHANIISYRVCDIGGCPGSAIIAGIEQSIDDQVVDVLNYSIGSTSPGSIWDDADTIAFLNARIAGIFVATSNGNSGPLPATVGSPAGTPWMTSVGASQHNRSYQQSITVTGGATYDGKGFTPALATPATVVYAGDSDNPLCLAGEFADGTDFTGQIVICDRGINGRVEKSEVVAGLGAVGFVLVNDPLNSASLGSDAFAVSGVHLSDVDGEALKAEVAGGDVTATISPSTAVTDDAFGLLQASFSSRGPNGSTDYITPDVTAPGVDIIAALGIATPDDDAPVEWGFLSGTSMSSPHTAGAGALLSAAHPDWSPAEAQSALMLTARYDGLLKEDNATPSDPYDHGSGYIDVDSANDTGLVLDEDGEGYLAANPAEGGDPTGINHASLSNQECLASCDWTRTLTPLVDTTWTINVVSDNGLTLTPDVDSITTTAGEDVDLAVQADVGDAPIGEPLFGRIVLTPADDTVPTAHLTVAVIPSAGIVPDEVVIDTRRDAGSAVSQELQTVAADPLQIEVLGLSGGDLEEFEIAQDPTNGDPYDSEEGVAVTTVDVPEGSSRLVADLIAAEAPDLDLFVGSGDTPSAATEICVSASATALETCEIPDPDAGTYWILIQNWEASAAAPDLATLSTVVVGGDEGNLTVVPSVASPELQEPYDLTVAYDLPMEPGQSYYGTIVLSTGDNEIGRIPVTVNRFADDVVKSADTEDATIGDTVGFTIEVADNVTNADMAYEIVDELPAGLDLVEDSVLVNGEAADGVDVADNTVTWTPTQPTLLGLDGNYEVSTGATDESCADGYSYLDLQSLGIPPSSQLTGDTGAFTTFATGAPLPFYESSYPGVTLSLDGYLDYTFDGTAYTQAAIGDPAEPNGILAGLLEDLLVTYDVTPGSETGIRLASTGDAPGALYLIDYDTVQPIDADGDPVGAPSTFQLTGVRGVSDAPGAYEFSIAFEDVGNVSGPLSVGIENIDGTRSTPVVSLGDGSTVITDGTTLCFDYVGPTLDSSVLSFDAVVTDDATATVTNEATSIDTADEYSQIETTSASINVEIPDGPVPTEEPTTEPTDEPTTEPTDQPTEEPTTEPTDDPTGTVTRLEGATRIETAVAISQDAFPDDGSADTVVVARADIPFDALAATPLSPLTNGPLLLTYGDTLHPSTLVEIQRVLADGGELIMLGGIDALSADVEDDLSELGDVTRLAGPTRVETALDVAEFIGDPEAILIAGSENFPDALTGGAAAAAADGLVLLSPEATPHPAVVAYLAERPDTPVYGIGGPAARAFPDAEGLVGSGREATARLVAETFFDDPTVIGLARGEEFADALTGGAHAALYAGPVLLTPSDLFHPEVQAYVCGTGLADGFVYGGELAISDDVAGSFGDALTGDSCDG